ncbi:MAG: ABC transporter ATP-binding protein [Bacteroidota bacterium]
MIELDNISFSLEGRQILKELNLNIRKGESLVVLGPSGAGKSSLLKIILGLWKPQTGSVAIDGTDLSGLNKQQLNSIRQKMALVFQGNALFDSLTVAGNVGFYLNEFSGMSTDDMNKRISECLAFVNLEDTEHMMPGQLSGGMKKRVAIARAIALNPEIILYDEPTTGLDPINARSIIELIMGLQRQGTTSVIVTHNLRDALSLDCRLAVIDELNVKLFDHPGEILDSKDSFIKEFFSELAAR